MIKLLTFLFLVSFPVLSHADASMRRCTLLPITDSVGGAIGYKVFEQVESDLKKSNWCTYVSNSGLINVFSRYRENLPQYLKSPEVIKTVAEKLGVGSIIRVSIINELKGVEIQMDVHGDNGEDLYFSEKLLSRSDEIEDISQVVNNWLETYSKTIPYDARINGVLGDQITLDVGKGYPIHEQQKFVVKRPVTKKKHPLLKKIVDWDTEILAEGSVFNISDNQALGMVKVYKTDKKLKVGDWVRLETYRQDVIAEKKGEEDKDDAKLGQLGILSVALFGTSSSVDTNTPTGSKRMSGNLFGVDFRIEGWITRKYFAAFELSRNLGTLKESSGNPDKNKVNANNGVLKLTGGYKYLPIGFFYGPQIDFYAGYANYSTDLDVSATDGFGKNSISGLLVGVNANIPINREYRFFAKADFMPFPTFNDDDDLFGSASSVSSLDFEVGIKYQYTPRMTVDGSIETMSRKAKFKGDFKEVSYKDNMLKVGVSFNF